MADTNPQKTVLSTASPKPFTVEFDGDSVMLQLHLNVLKLGKVSTAWLLNALKNLSHEKQILKDGESKLIEVFQDSGYVYILGRQSRFTMNSEVAAKLIGALTDYIGSWRE